jgi:putative hemolysin
MGYLWDGKAVIKGGEKISKESSAGPASLLFAGMLLLVFLLASPSSSADANSAQSYCVKMGYLYRALPTAGGMEERCIFPDSTYCEAKAFLNGTCTRTPYPSSSSYVYSGSADWGPQARRMCANSGGRLREVHTPYGDVVTCAFPDGSICDLRALLAGMCGDNWFSYAYGWLHAT